MSQQAAVTETETIVPFRFWWGLLACAFAMGLIFAFAPYSTATWPELAPDKGNWWYAWQLQNPTVITRLSAWIPYTLHIVSIWYLIHAAKKAKPKYIYGLHTFNLWALGVNAFFVVLHIAQTKLFYDGLAQDVHEATSMGSVTLMLFLILLMENRRRGLFFGRKVTFMNSVGDTLRRYHGYYFAWAIIYTFWYHPVEMTSGHLAGFGYMYLLLLQSSLFYTRFHVNRVWTMTLETMFVIHGALVAAFVLTPGQDNFWSQFLFGGCAIFLITQLHGLGLGTRAKLLVASPIVAVMAGFYLYRPDLLPWLGTLPFTMYVGTFLVFIAIWAVRFGVRSLRGSVPQTGGGPEATA